MWSRLRCRLQIGFALLLDLLLDRFDVDSPVRVDFSQRLLNVGLDVARTGRPCAATAMSDVALALIEAAKRAGHFLHFIVYGGAEGVQTDDRPQHADRSQRDGLGRENQTRLVFPQFID